MLDFDNIQEITKEYKKQKLAKREEPKEPIIFSLEEEKLLNSWIKDLEKYIVNWALTR